MSIMTETRTAAERGLAEAFASLPSHLYSSANAETRCWAVVRRAVRRLLPDPGALVVLPLSSSPSRL